MKTSPVPGGAAKVANGATRSAAPPPQELHTYRNAVQSGHYARDAGGLRGKHDNVRRAWEDQVTRFALHGFLEPVVQRKRAALERMRVLDLGCGSGEGYEILTSLRKPDGELAWAEVEALSDAMIGAYRGLDISPAMVEQGRLIHAANQKVTFDVCDLSRGLGPAAAEPSFDIYFSSFGSLSHLVDADLASLVGAVCDHMGERAVFVADLIGRYSYEWPAHWEGAGVRPYSMSYLHAGALGEEPAVERFPLRYWGGEEVDAFLSETVRAKGVHVVRRHLQDRSVLVGRHMDTAELNPLARPIRGVVNRLHEPHLRTDLRELIFDYMPAPGHDRLNQYFERFQMAWNAVVESAIEALDRWDDPVLLAAPPPDDLPAPVRDAIRTIRDVVRNVKWFRMGDPRANIIEPQLGYVLRNLEVDMQQGLGAAHGLLACFELSREPER